MACPRPFKACKRPVEKLDYGVDFLMDCIRKREPNTGYAAGVRVRPSTEQLQTGFEYISSGGVTEFDEPAWPETVGAEIVDGSITWTAAAPTTDSLKDRLSTVVWSAHADLTISDENIGDDAGQQMATANISGGQDGETYEVAIFATTVDGLQFDRIIALKVKD
jgi:hypothetical protein